MLVIFALLDPDPENGSTDQIESVSGSEHCLEYIIPDLRHYLKFFTVLALLTINLFLVFFRRKHQVIPAFVEKKTLRIWQRHSYEDQCVQRPNS